MNRSDAFEFRLTGQPEPVDAFVDVVQQLQQTVEDGLVVPLMAQSTTDIAPPDTVFEVLPELNEAQSQIGDLNGLFFDLP